jgi:hypothetical protein
MPIGHRGISKRSGQGRARPVYVMSSRLSRSCRGSVGDRVPQWLRRLIEPSRCAAARDGRYGFSTGRRVARSLEFDPGRDPGAFEPAIVGRAGVRSTVPGAKCTAERTGDGAVRCGELETADRASAAEALRSRSDLARWRSPSAYGSGGCGPRQRTSDDGAASATSTDAEVDAGQHPQGLLPVDIRQPEWHLSAGAL